MEASKGVVVSMSWLWRFEQSRVGTEANNEVEAGAVNRMFTHLYLR